MLWLLVYLAIGWVTSYPKDCALAQQIKPDDTLGDERSVVQPLAPGSSVDVISGGATRDTNWFHSFEQFSVPSGREVHFNNAPNIQNIISRITGASISNIDGLLRANGTANLFLINPNGIVFGRNASLAVGGSFIATTAGALHFADGKQFSAKNSSTSDLLTVSVPAGLQFNDVAATIVNQSDAINKTGLAVNSGKTLGFVGGNIIIQGGILVAPEGRIELGSVDTNSQVSLNLTDRGWMFGYEGVQNFRDINLIQGSSIGANGQGGSVHLQSRRVEIADGSKVFATVDQGAQPGGELTINASDSVRMMGDQTVLSTGTLSEGDSGNIVVNTGSLIVQDKAVISTASFTIQISPEVVIQATGRAGNLTVTAPNLVSVSSGSALSTQTQGPGDSGNLRIETGQLIVQDDRSRITSFTDEGSTGNGGNLTLQTRQLNVRNGGTVTASSRGLGNAGNLVINTDLVQLDRGTLTAQTESGEGNITIQGGSIQLRNNSLISTEAERNGSGGNITINADTLVGLENSDIVANADYGKGGFIQITAQGVFGIESRDQERDLLTSDITAFSQQNPQLNGEIEINTPDINPSQGLVTLPIQPVNVTGLIAQGCSAGGAQVASRFVVTGRGGLPDNPSQTLSSDTVWSDLRSFPRSDAYQLSAEEAIQPTNSTTEQLVEAQGWVISNKGEVVLTAAAPNVTPHSSWMTSIGCHAP